MSDHLDHARHDPALALAPVFAALPTTKDSVRAKFDVQQRFDNCELRWHGPEALGALEQSLLLALIAMGAVQKYGLTGDATSALGQGLLSDLKQQGDIAAETLVAVECSWRSLARAAGLMSGGGAALKQVQAGVKRLAEVTVSMTHDGRTTKSQLLAWRVDDSKRVTLALSWRLSRAIRGVQHSRISLTERLALTNAAARILHAWLSACVRPNGSMRFRIETLVGHIWYDPATGSTPRTRYARVNQVLDQIGALPGWTVERHNDLATIARQKVRQVADKPASSRSTSDLPEPNTGAGLRPDDAPVPRLAISNLAPPLPRARKGAPTVLTVVPRATPEVAMGRCHG